MNFELTQDSPYFFPIIACLVIISLSLIIYFTMKRESVDDVAAVPEEAPLIVQVPEEVQQEVVQPTGTESDLAPVAPTTSAPAELTTADLLPGNDAARAFEAKFPSGQGEATDKNFLIAGYNIGINTVGGSMKNPNLSLRSDPYIPRKTVSIWNESTIMASDLTNRKEFNIGS